MASKDRWDGSPAALVYPDTAATTGDGTDSNGTPIKISNRRRRERIDLRVTGTMNVTAPAPGGPLNAGSILGAVSRLKFRTGGKPLIDIDARCAQKRAEFLAGAALPAIRAGDGQNQNTVLTETFPLWLALPGSVNPNETKYLDPSGENLVLDVDVVSSKRANLPGILRAGGAATLTGLTIQAVDVYDEDVAVAPDYRIWGADEIQVANFGKQSTLRQDIKLSPGRLVSDILLQVDSDLGEVQGIQVINSVTLRTDKNFYFYKVPWLQFIEALTADMGGVLPGGLAYLFLRFGRYGRNSAWLDPYGEDTGLRFEFDVDPTAAIAAGFTNPFIRIVPTQYERIAGVTASTTAHERSQTSGAAAGPVAPK